MKQQQKRKPASNKEENRIPRIRVAIQAEGRRVAVGLEQSRDSFYGMPAVDGGKIPYSGESSGKNGEQPACYDASAPFARWREDSASRRVARQQLM